ncbi:hypothetical protein AAFG07_34225 [Bradyrhizobium sp. B097]|uniref:hypothetical protein n=1 Tax=Bradyrhizobium sp. B097 TaxID=3140244 RepID=UPI00318348FE
MGARRIKFGCAASDMAGTFVVFAPAAPFEATTRLQLDSIVNDNGLRVSAPFRTFEVEFAAEVK